MLRDSTDCEQQIREEFRNEEIIVNIYFDNYPIYKTVGRINISLSGKVIVYPHQNTDSIIQCSYFVLPANISSYIVRLINKN